MKFYLQVFFSGCEVFGCCVFGTIAIICSIAVSAY